MGNGYMAILAIILLSILVYRNTWSYGLVVDDVRRYKEIIDGYLQNISFIEQIRRRLYGVGTLSIDKRVNLRDEHILSTLIHTATSIIIYLGFGADLVSFCAGVLYLINPANNQTAVWLNGRRYAINCLIVASMVWLGPISLILYPLACLLQVSAIFAPLLFGWYALLALPLFWLVAGPQTIDRVKHRLIAGRITSPDLTTISFKKIIPAIKTYGLYCLKMVFPNRTMMCYSHLFYWGMTKDGNKDAYKFDLKFLGGVIALILTGLMAGYFWGKPQFFMVLFMFASTFQWCGLISVTQMFTDRYISLPNIFAMYFVAYFANQYLGAYSIPVLFLLGGYYYANLKISLGMYRSLEDFWNYHFYFNPADPKCREFKASTLLKNGDPMGAWAVVKEGLKYNPNDYKLNLLAANCMACLQDHKSTLIYIRKAKESCYYGQEFILKDLQKNIFKFDIDKEIADINAKTSSRPQKERENIQKIYNLVNA